MDTKSKNTEVIQHGERRYHWFWRTIAILAVVIAACFIVRGICLLGTYGAMDSSDYAQSSSLAEQAVTDTTAAWGLMFYYGSEEQVREGTSPAGRELRQTVEELQADSDERVKEYEEELKELQKELSRNESDEGLQKEVETLEDQIRTEQEECAAGITEEENTALEEVRQVEAAFSEESGLYAAYVSGDICTATVESLTDAASARAFFEALPAAVYAGTGYYSEQPENAVPVNLSANLTIPGSGTLYVGYSAERYAQMEKSYQEAYAMGKRGPGFILWGGVVMVGALCWLCYGAGCSSRRRGVKLLWIDRVYTDVLFFLTIAAIALCIWLATAMSQAVSSTSVGSTLLEEFAAGRMDDLTLLCVYAPVVAGTMMGIAFILSCARKVKMGVMIRQSFFGVVASLAVRLIRRAVDGGTKDLPKKPMRTMVGITLMEALFVPLAIAAAVLFEGIGVLCVGTLFVMYNLWLVGRLKSLVREYYQLTEDVRRIGGGELSHRVDESDFMNMKSLADGINDIAKGLEASLEERMRSERMRTELITNVSHDLRTPLTSLITYVDLLRKVGLDSEKAPEYLDVLDKKSHRLKTLTDDLFEAAKAASGTLPVQIGRIDLQALLTQGLAEISDRVEQSGLTICTSYPKNRVYALADGRRLWRAEENLISNALKYSLEGTRIYLDVFEEEGRACISLKNISRDPLSMSREQLMERFVRGDSARHSEGSGLGLSISGSLCELMNGRLELEVDGDLFKATILLPAADAAESC